MSISSSTPSYDFTVSPDNKQGLIYQLYVQERSPNIVTLQHYAKDRDAYAAQVKLENRNAKLVKISFPITMEFSVVRAPLLGSNKTSIKLYNLNDETRERISKYRASDNPYRYVELQVGYSGIFRYFVPPEGFPVVARGYLNTCTSIKEGTDIITTIEFYGCYEMLQRDLMGTKAVSSIGTISGGTTFEKTIEILAQVFDKYDDRLNRLRFSARARLLLSNYRLPRSLTPGANVVDMINQVLQGRCKLIFDGPQIYVIAENEHIRSSGKVNKITSSSGLLSVPVMESPSIISFDIIFEPRFIIFQQLSIESDIFLEIAKNSLDGDCQGKIVSIAHSGVVSGSVTSKVVTKITMVISADSQEALMGYSPEEGGRH